MEYRWGRDHHSGKRMKEYHIYFENNCIFKELSELQFTAIWPLLNTAYNSELSFTEIAVNHTEQREYEESSY